MKTRAFSIIAVIILLTCSALAFMPQRAFAVTTAEYNKAFAACNTKAKNDPCVVGYVNADKGQNACQAYVGTAAEGDCITGVNAAKKANNQTTVTPVSNNSSSVQATNTSATTSGTTDNSNSDGPPTCEASGVSLSWILCPIINILASATDAIYSSIVQPLLVTQPININNPSQDPTHTFAIWSNFRIYGDIFLVIALLVIVFGEAIGGGMIDSYTAKKILPRLLIAAVLINLSIYIVAFAVDITNIIGKGVEALIEAPFRGAGQFKFHISGFTGDIGTVAVVGGIFAAKAALAASLAEMLLLFFLIPAFLVMLAILVTVMVRRGLILLLILVAPIAFALYCLPNTEQYFRRWWDLLWRTLLVYPLIAVFFALGNVLAITISSTTTGISKPVADLVSIIALFVPLFLIPYSFRIAGGILGRIHDFATNAQKRAHQGILGSEHDQGSWRNKAKARNRMARENSNLTGEAFRTRFIPLTNPLTPGGRAQRRRNIEAQREASRIRSGQMYAEADKVFQANKGNDQYLLAVANRKMAERNRDNATDPTERAAWESAIGAASITHSSPAVRLQALQSLAGTGFQFDTGEEGYNELARTVADITGVNLEMGADGTYTGIRRKRDASGNIIRDANGNEMAEDASVPNAGTYANAMNFAQFNSRQAGRFDLGGINNGVGFDYEAGISKATGFTAGQAKPNTFKAGAEHYLGTDLKTDAIKNSKDLAADINKNLLSGKTTVDQVSAWHAKLLDSQMSATGVNKDEIGKQIEAIENAANPGGLDYANNPNNPAAPPSGSVGAALNSKLHENHRQLRRNIDPNLMEDK
jgi:hypothetical protein